MRWQHEFGEYAEIVLYHPTQGERGGFMVLLAKDGVPKAFIKLRPSESSRLDQEYQVLSTVSNARPKTFSTPAPLGLHGDKGWQYLAMTPLPARLHTVVDEPQIDRIAHEIRDILQHLRINPEKPDGWTYMHGDFTPWNLRNVGMDKPMLFDWGDVEPAPIGADETYYRVADFALTGTSVSLHDRPEAVAFWRDRLKAQGGHTARDTRLRRRMQQILDQTS